MDYNQTEDDGHDVYASSMYHLYTLTDKVISRQIHSMVIGVAPSDGTIHLSFDHHDNELKYRVSQPGVASSPNSTNTTWTAELFGPIVVSSQSLCMPSDV